MAFGFYFLAFFLPFSSGLNEWGFGIAFIAFNVKRFYVLTQKCRTTSVSISNFPNIFIQSFKPISSVYHKPLCIYLTFVTISLFFSASFPTSMKGYVFKFLQELYLFFMVIECFKSHRQVRIWLAVFASSCVLISFNGWIQYFFGQGFLRGRELLSDNRVISTFKHPNDFAGYVIIPVMMFMSLFLHNIFLFFKKINLFKSEENSNVIKFLLLICIVFFPVVFGIFGLSFSRGAWVGLIVGSSFLVYIKPRQILGVVLVLAMFFMVFIPQLKATRKISLMSDSLNPDYRSTIVFETVAADESSSSLNLKENVKGQSDRRKIKFLNFTGMGRTEYWKEAFGVIKDHPWTGSGWNTYSLVAPKYKNNWGGYTHNCYLQTFAEIGIPGGIAMIWFFIFFVFHSAKVLRPLNNIEAVAGVGLLVGVVGFLVQSSIDTNFYSNQLGSLLWMVMGVIVAIQNLKHNHL